MAKRFSIETVFGAVDKITAPVARMQSRVGKFTRSMERGLRRVSGATKKVGAAIKSASLVASGAILATGAALLDVIKTGAQFEETIVGAAAKFPGEIRKGTAAFKELSDAAKLTGKTTEFSASEAAAGLNFLAMAGFDAKSAIAALPGVVNLATAAGIELGQATDIASDSLGAFGLATKDAAQLGKNLARVNDVIAKTTTGANTNVEQMFEAIAEGAPIATAAGASVETFAALVGKLADAGIKGGKAGTTLKNVFLRLSAPVPKAAKALEKYGIVTKDADGNLRDVVDILGDMDKALGGLGTAERAEVLDKIFGKIPIAGVNVLLKTGTENINSFRKGLENAEGSSKTLADTMRDTVVGSFKSLMSSIEGVKISIFEMSSGPLKEVIDSMTEWVRANEGLISSKIGGFLKFLITNFSEIVSWAKKIAIGLAIFATIGIILKGFILVMTAVNLVMLLNPIGLIVLGIVALIAGITAAIIWVDQFTDAFKVLGNVVDSVKGFFGFGDELPKEIKGPKVVFDKNSKIPDMSATDKVFSDQVRGLQGGGGEEAEREREQRIAEIKAAAIITPAERITRSIQETSETNKSEVTILTPGGQAEVTGGKLPSGITLQPSGSL